MITVPPMDSSPQKEPGFRLVWAIIGVLIAAGAWEAFQRTVIIDGADGRTPAGATAPWPDMRVELNTATAAELALLPGVGPRLAERIVERRTMHGAFRSLSDLAEVERVGPAVLEQIAPYVVIDDTSAAATQPASHLDAGRAYDDRNHGS